MMCLAFASSAPWYHHRRCKQCLWYKSPLPYKDLLGSIPNPLNVLRPAGAALQLTILLTSTKSLRDKPQTATACPRALLLSVVFSLPLVLFLLRQPRQCHAAQSGKFTTVISATAFSTVCKMCSIFSTVSADRTTSPHCSHFRQGHVLDDHNTVLQLNCVNGRAGLHFAFAEKAGHIYSPLFFRSVYVAFQWSRSGQ